MLCCLLPLSGHFLPGRGRWIKLASVLAVYLILNSVCPYGSFILILTLVMLAVAKCLGLPKSLVFLLTLLYFNARISGGLLVQSPYFIMEQFFPQSSAMPERFLFYSSLLTMLLCCHTLSCWRSCFMPSATAAQTASDASAARAVLYQFDTNGGNFVRSADLPGCYSRSRTEFCFSFTNDIQHFWR